MEKIRRNRADTTQRIVNALEDVLAEQGLEGARINQIAEKAGISKVLIYRYFGGLDGLMEYYVRMGRMFPHFTPAMLDQIRPIHQDDLAKVWYRQAIQMFRYMRTSKAAREVLKANVVENDPTADVISKAQDDELQRLVNQLSFIEGPDSQAISAVMLGALSYLTIQAQNNHTMVGIDLRSEQGWQRIEGAVKLIYLALNKMAIDTQSVKLSAQAKAQPASQW
ncbi:MULTISPECIES: TetR/AcrR family transcriptional regulator [Spirosoma]|uniref:Transcriptional regulator, TetR family n=1 Tax=Spirosoma linguale (strain ATCC 33905 / DSM 74 / LMG 10896 / Claus 1) TaxID=504472 RepID=D2QU71_SPILD|nr:TetR/AcrR family transcriptional regulator [Spirosoma sp.]ADB42353.1 transcriptional regulator, TetR family [Spirosoma linguale DSM 74]MCX6218970.1 TetR/AcrR family transcriptional regulator [Spirosoma sp.]